MPTRYDVVVAARGWIGTRVVHQHRARGVGVDCAGLLIGVARDLLLVEQAFDVTGYGSRPDGHALKAYCDAHMTPIAREEMGIGDAVLVAWGEGLPQHLGIVADYAHGGLSMIHAEGRRHHRVIETRLLFGRSMRFVAAYRFPGVA